MAAIDPRHNYLVVSGALWHEGYVEEVEAAAAALAYAEHGTEVRVLLVVRELDMSEWERCPNCGAAVEKGIGCWSEECSKARMKTPCG